MRCRDAPAPSPERPQPPPVASGPLARAISGTLLINVLGLGAAFVAQIVVARTVGQSEFGVYAYTLAWVSVLGMAGRAGFDLSALRFVPRYDATREWSLLRGFRVRSVQIPLILCVSTSVVVLCVHHARPQGVNLVGVAGAVLLPVSVLLTVQGSTLQALGSGRSSQALQTLVRPILVAVTLLAAAWTWGGIGAAGGIFVNAWAALACCVPTALLIRRRMPPGSRSAAPAYLTRLWVLESLPLLALVGANTFLEQSDVLQVGWYLGPEYVGGYAAAARVALLTQLGAGSSSIIIAPLISRLHSTRRHGELQRIVSLAAWGNTIVSAAAFVAILLLGERVLSLFGKGFSGAFPALVILAGGRAILGSMSLAGYVLTLTGRHFATVLVIAVGIAVNLGLGWVMIPRHSVVGAACAMAGAMIVWGTGLSVACRRLTGINPTPFARPRVRSTSRAHAPRSAPAVLVAPVGKDG